jgi:biotin carboxyl carrier protein
MADQTADPKADPKAEPQRHAPNTEEHHFKHPSGRVLTIAAVIVVGLIIVFILVGYLPRHSREKDLEARARAAVVADSVPIVDITRVARADVTSDINLPGTLQSNRTGSVYARSSGYVRRWYADIGQHVRAGQTLADIEAPDLDQQLVQSRQNVLNQQATMELNRVNLARWKILYQDSAVTKQELDTYQSGYDASVASVAAAQADVRRLEALVGYEKVTAPFTGVITARNVDNGTFVTGSGTTSASLPAGPASCSRYRRSTRFASTLACRSRTPRRSGLGCRRCSRSRSCQGARSSGRWPGRRSRWISPRAHCSRKSTSPTRVGFFCRACTGKCILSSIA